MQGWLEIEFKNLSLAMTASAAIGQAVHVILQGLVRTDHKCFAQQGIARVDGSGAVVPAHGKSILCVVKDDGAAAVAGDYIIAIDKKVKLGPEPASLHVVEQGQLRQLAMRRALGETLGIKYQTLLHADHQKMLL